jgi:hypothetical protein
MVRVRVRVRAMGRIRVRLTNYFYSGKKSLKLSY